MLKIQKLLSSFMDVNNLESDETWNSTIDETFKKKYQLLISEKQFMTPDEIKSDDLLLVDLFNQLHDIEEIEEEQLPDVQTSIKNMTAAERKRQERQKAEQLKLEKAEEEKNRIAQEKAALEKEKSEIQKQKELEEQERQAEIQKSKQEEQAKLNKLNEIFSKSSIRKSELAQLGIVFSGNRHDVVVDNVTYRLSKKIGYPIYRIQKIN